MGLRFGDLEVKRGIRHESSMSHLLSILPLPSRSPRCISEKKGVATTSHLVLESIHVTR